MKTRGQLNVNVIMMALIFRITAGGRIVSNSIIYNRQTDQARFYGGGEGLIGL